MRRAARTDANQPEIVAALLKAGCSVQSLASVGLGVPDLLIGRLGINYLLEVKDGAKFFSRRILSDDEKKWHKAWTGQVRVVHNIPEALAACGISPLKTTHLSPEDVLRIKEQRA